MVPRTQRDAELVSSALLTSFSVEIQVVFLGRRRLASIHHLAGNAGELLDEEGASIH
jgi:hypothetical protein